MLLPYLQPIKSATKKYVVAFKGLNFGEGWQDGDLLDCTNLSSEKYPCISQRAAREQVATYISPTTLHTKGGLLVIDGTRVLYENEYVGDVTPGRKQTETIGNYIVIFPDKKYYNVATKVFGNMEETYTATGLVFTDSSITTTGEDFPFRDGDGVTITGCATAENNKTPIIRGVSGKELIFSANTFTATTEEASVTIKRAIPDLEFICESNYRLWGTKGNTIYSSAYSDPLNFNVFDGVAADSYAIDVGTDGAFTGCIPYSSHICFFKENSLHKLYGVRPSNFQLVSANVYGVQAGCERSLKIVNEQLLYKGVEGVYSYTGGVPELISARFGTKRYHDAAATCDGERYYISMRHGEKWCLFVYDVLRNMWLCEDDTHAIDLTFHDGHVYLLDEEGALYKINRTADRSDVEWSATFCPFNETMNERKGYSKFHLRADLAEGAWLAVDIMTDQDTQWREVYVGHNERAKTISVPIVPNRCDSVTIRLRGKGECVVKTFVREFTTGSDV